MKFLKAVLFIVFVFAALAVHAQSGADLKTRHDELTRQLDQLKKEYDQTVKNKKATPKQLSLLREQITLREQEININDTSRLIRSKQTNLKHSGQQ